MNSREKFAIALASLQRSGGNRTLLDLSNAKNNFVEISKIFYINTGKEIFAKPDLDFSVVEINKKNLFTYIYAVLKLSIIILKDKTIDGVVISDPVLVIFSFIYCRKKRVIRYVQGNCRELYEYNKHFNFLQKKIYKFLIKLTQKFNYHKVLFNSNYSLESYNSTSSKKFSKDCIINPGVFNSNVDALPKTFPINDYINICLIGSEHFRKGFYLFKNIFLNTTIHNIKFTVISSHNFDFYPDKINYIKINEDAELNKIFNDNDFFLSTSTFEGFGLPVLEAMSIGLVPICFFNYGLLEYKNNKNMFIINSVNDFDLIINNFINKKISYFNYSKNAINTSKKFTIHKYIINFLHKITN